MSHYKSYYLKSLGLTEDALPGGKGDETTPQQISPQELEMGIQVEMEHTQDPNLAKEIAMDHLTEDPQYYTHLKSAGMADELPNGQQPNQGPMQMSKLMSPTPAQFMPVIGVAVRGSSTGGFPGGGVHDRSDKARYGGLEPVKNPKANSQGTTEHTDQLPPSNGSKLTPANDEIGKGTAPVTAPKGNKDIHPHQVQQLGTPPPDDDGTGRMGDIKVSKKTEEPSTVEEPEENEPEENEPKHKKVWGFDLKDKEEDDDAEDKEVSIDIKETKEPEGKKEKEEWIKPWVPKKKDDVEESMAHKFQRLANINEEGVGASEPFVTKWKMDKEKAGMVKKEAGALSEIETVNEIISIIEKMDKAGKTSPLLEKARRFLTESFHDPADVLQGAAEVQSGQFDTLIQLAVQERQPGATVEDVAGSVIAKAEDMGMKNASGLYDYVVSLVTKNWDQGGGGQLH